VNSPLALVGAGLSFTGTALAGLLIGILAAQRTGQQLWVVAGLFGGILVGAYAAIRLILRGN
jgi:hypothetical protein